MIRRDLAVALAGIGGGQALLFLAMPFLARAFGPAAFGSYAVVVSIAGVLSIVAALRFDLAIVSATDEDVPALTRAAFVLPLVVVPAALCFLAVVLASPWGEALPFASGALPAIGAIAVLQGLALVGAALGTRLGAFSTVAAMKILQPAGFALTALFLLHDLEMAMAVGWLIAMLASVRLFRGIPLARGWSRSWATSKRMWRFAALSSPMAVLDALALALPLLVIAASFGDEAAGNYSQVQRLIGAPLTLLAMAASQVFMKYAGDRLRKGQAVMPLLARFALFMAMLDVLVLIAVILVGDPLLRLLVGPGWRTDTMFLILALLPIVFRVIASPVSSVLILTHRLWELAAWQLGYFLTTAATLFAAARWLDFEGLLIALAINEFLLYTIYLLLSARAARHPPREVADAELRILTESGN